MATASGTENLTLARNRVEERLFAEPYSFEFMQAVRLLRQFHPNRDEVGNFRPPSDEVARFGVNPSLAFPASEIQSVENREDGQPFFRVNFMGLVGPLGILPIYYTELVENRVWLRDRTVRDFFDLFHHRIISIFYRAWQKYRFIVAFEQGENDRLSEYLLAVIGLRTPQLANRQPIADQALTYYAGLLGQQPRSAETLKLILQDYFGIPVTIEQFLGAWYRLDGDSQCNLDDDMLDSQQLGFGAVVGDEIWDPQSRVRVVLGPLPLQEYLDFLPSGTAFAPLRSLVRFIAGDEFDVEAQLILRREDVPGCQLGAGGEAAPQLGWVSWSKSKMMDRDASETILQL
ncbi:MAG TPA: type VI secretion system baseplate subunit TssG [Bryobacteraceae bacterium]|jgi:type VI secretion system protein ImpH|nr:type VI secretion system baseplate subunit TssG [Bryobacteraceae bacterium]